VHALRGLLPATLQAVAARPGRIGFAGGCISERLEPERLADPFGDGLVPGLAGDLLDDCAEHDIAAVIILPALAGLRRGGAAGSDGDEVGGAVGPQRRLAAHEPGDLAEILDAGAVAQQLPDGGGRAGLREISGMKRDIGIVERDLALGDQLEDGRGGELLDDRAQLERSVRGVIGRRASRSANPRPVA
jgi:hypothetical protein